VAKQKEDKTKKSPALTIDTPEKKEKSKLLDERGKFAKGHKKVGGRAAGTKNRNSNIRDRLKEQVEPFIESIAENLMKVQKEEGTAAMMTLQEKFMPYFMPKYSAMSLSADQDRPISEEERLLELDGLYTKKELSINFKSMTVVNNDKLHSSDPDADEDDFDLSIFDTTEG
jgi:hypothetical protein